jgi:hypothetical protein
MRKLLRLLIPASVIYVLLCAAAAVFLADTTLHPIAGPFRLMRKFKYATPLRHCSRKLQMFRYRQLITLLSAPGSFTRTIATVMQ